MRITPTNVAPGVILEDEDYDWKAGIDGLPRSGSGLG
jgi:hypothetical protein